MTKTRLRTLLRIAAPLVTVLLVVGIAGDATACPTCKDGLAENDPSTQIMAAGYFYSILFMMSMPFLIIGTFGSFAYLSIRKAREQEASSAERVHDPAVASS